MSKTLVGLSLVLGLLSANLLAGQSNTYTVILSCDKGVTASATVELWYGLETHTTVSVAPCFVSCGADSISGKKTDRVRCPTNGTATGFNADSFSVTIGTSTTICLVQATNITDPPMGCPDAAAPNATLSVK